MSCVEKEKGGRYMYKNGQVVTHSHLADLFGVKTLKTTRFIKERNTFVNASQKEEGGITFLFSVCRKSPTKAGLFRQTGT